MRTPFLAVTLLALSTTFAFAKGVGTAAKALALPAAQTKISVNAGQAIQADTISLSAKVAHDLATHG